MADGYINPNVYTGGAVTFNSAPFVNYAMQRRAKQQAKEAELDKQILDQTKDLTPTGMRAVDLPGWNAKFQKLKELSIRNKENLRDPSRDNYQTFREVNRLRGELRTEPELSKQAGQFHNKVGELRLEGKWIPTDEDEVIVKNAGKSIYDRDWKSPSLTDLSVNAPPFDNTKFLTEAQAGRKRGVIKDVANATIYKDKRIMEIPTYEQYSPEDMKGIADNAKYLMQKDRGAKKFFTNISENIGDHPQIQAAYAKMYGANEVVDTPEKAAQGYALLSIPERTAPGKVTDEWKDVEGDLARQMGLIDYRAKKQIEVNAAKASSDKSKQENVLNDQVNGIVADSKLRPVPITATTWEKDDEGKKVITGVKQLGATRYNVELTPEIAKALIIPGQPEPDAAHYVKQNGKGYIMPIVYKKNRDEQGYPISIQTDPKGDPIIDNTYSKRKVPLHQFRNSYGNVIYSGNVLVDQVKEDFKFEDEDDTQITPPPQKAPAPKPAAPPPTEDKKKAMRAKYKYGN